MSRQYWAETLAWATASGTPVTNTTTETIIFPNVTIPANYMQDGRVIRLRVIGQISTGTGPPTINWGVRWGGVAGTLICKTGAMTTIASITATMFDYEVYIQTRTNGSAGTLMGNGVCRVWGGALPTVGSATGAPAIAPFSLGGVTTPGTVSVDLTADTALAITATWSGSSTSHTLTGLNYTIEGMN